MAALYQQQRVSIAEAYAQLVGRVGVEVCAGSSMPAIRQEMKEHPTQQQPLVYVRASTGTPSIRESTPVLQCVGKLSGTAVRPFDPAGLRAARHQRRTSMAASIERAKRAARAKWEAERPSILAELKQNRPASNDEQHRQVTSRESSERKSALPVGAWQPPTAAAPKARADRTADEELARLRAQMQQMKQYVQTMEAMVSQQLASKAVAGPLVGETTRPSDPGITPDSQPQITLPPVAEEDSAAEVESPLSTVDLDTQLLFETFETARHACAEVGEAEAEHGSMLERVSTSPLAKDQSRVKSTAGPAAQMSSTRSPLGMLRVDPNNARTRASTSFSSLQPTKRSEIYAAGRGSPNAESPARPSVSPKASFTSASPAADMTYTEYNEYEEYADSSDGSPAAPWGVPVSAAVVEGTEQRVVLRGRLSF